jgi:hypothetical protein
VHASDADLNRRLLNIRKNKARYSKHGIVIPPATKVTPHPSVVPRYAHVIEFSLARLHSRYGVSIDDILINPELAAEYEAMASAAAPGLSSLELRLAALYIRKTRFIASKDAGIVQSLDPERLESAFVDVGSLNSLKPSAVPGGEGMVEILEHNRHLYISRNEDLRAAVDQIASPSSLGFMSNEFWHPNPADLQIRVFAGRQFLKVSLSQWQLKLISEKKPVFNWPVTAKPGGSGPKRQRAA